MGFDKFNCSGHAMPDARGNNRKIGDLDAVKKIGEQLTAIATLRHARQSLGERRLVRLQSQFLLDYFLYQAIIGIEVARRNPDILQETAMVDDKTAQHAGCARIFMVKPD